MVLSSQNKSRQDELESLNPSQEALIFRKMHVGSSYKADKAHGPFLTGWKYARLLGRHRKKLYFFNLLRADVKIEDSSSEPYLHAVKYCSDLSAPSLSSLH